jgi:hypothetical protein
MSKKTTDKEIMDTDAIMAAAKKVIASWSKPGKLAPAVNELRMALEETVKAPDLYIVVEGGVVQGVASNNPALADGVLGRILVVDYDTQGDTDVEVMQHGIDQADAETLAVVAGKDGGPR